jgi:transposase
MRFYQKEHKYYCGIDLHARAMYVCIVNRKGKILYHENLETSPEILFDIIFPYLEDVVVCVECMFCWYWIADFCREHHIPFVLAHALYLKAIHGGKTKNDKIDSRKIAMLLRGGNIPMAYAYPKERRAIRDLLRRRMHLMHKRAELIAHIVNTNAQYNLPPFTKKLAYKTNRIGIAERFTDPHVRKSIELDLAVIETYDKQLLAVERYIEDHARIHDPTVHYRVKTIPGVGKILSLVLIYEIDDIKRFPRVQDFASYARLIRPQKVSDGKWAGKSNKKIGNPHLKWALSEIAIIMLRVSPEAKKLVERLRKRHSKGKALGIFTHKLGRAIYYMLKNDQAFDMNKFYAA